MQKNALPGNPLTPVVLHKSAVTVLLVLGIQEHEDYGSSFLKPVRQKQEFLCTQVNIRGAFKEFIFIYVGTYILIYQSTYPSYIHTYIHP